MWGGQEIHALIGLCVPIDLAGKIWGRVRGSKEAALAMALV